MRFRADRAPMPRLALCVSAMMLLHARSGPARVPPVRTPAETVRDKVCRQPPPPAEDGGVGLMALPSPGRGNGSGVVLLVNCTSRRIVSLTDPSRSPTHLRRRLYDPARRARLPHDPGEYGALNFNPETHNSSFDHTAYARDQDWRGPCLFRDLEIVTADPKAPTVQETVVFSLDICRSQMLAILPPAIPVRTLRR